MNIVISRYLTILKLVDFLIPHFSDIIFDLFHYSGLSYILKRCAHDRHVLSFKFERGECINKYFSLCYYSIILINVLL